MKPCFAVLVDTAEGQREIPMRARNAGEAQHKAKRVEGVIEVKSATQIGHDEYEQMCEARKAANPPAAPAGPLNKWATPYLKD